MEARSWQIAGILPRPSVTVDVSQRVLKSLSKRAPLTILRGPRGFGKTTSIVRVLSAHEGPADLAYLTLNASARFAGDFWRQLLELLNELRPEAAPQRAMAGTAGEAQQHCVALLRSWAEPLLLVIDNYHEAGLRDGAETIDHELIEALRVNPELELVVATRALRTLETTGSLSLDAQILRPQDLALSIEDVQRLATTRGLVVDFNQAAQLRADLGGWPAAIRGCLDAAAVAGGDATVDAMLVDGYLTAMLEDIRSEALKEFLLRSAVPEEISETVIQAITPGDGALSHLRSALMGGLMHERSTLHGPRYAYAPAIRDSILRYVRRTRPELIREVHRALMPLAAAEEGAIGVLRHAVAAEEWDAALEVLREEWTALISRHRWSLEELAKHFPHNLLAEKARLQYLTQGSSGATSHDRVRWSSPQPAFLDLAMSFRAQEWPGDEDPVMIGFQAAVAAVFGGDNELAIAEFAKIREHGLATEDHSANLLGSVGLAMGKAIHGEAREALDLIRNERLAEFAASFPHDGLRGLASVGVSIAQALASVDALIPDVDEVIEQLIEPPRRDELWGLAVAVRAMHAAIVGDATMRAHHGGSIRNALRHLHPKGVTAATLGSVLAELQIQSGFPSAAEQVLDRQPASAVLDGSRAVLLAHCGDMAEALRLAEDVLATRGITMRNRVTCELVSSWALYAQGHHAAATRSFDNAVFSAHDSGQRRPFQFIPANVLRAVGSGHGLSELRPDLDPVRPGTPKLVLHEFGALATLSEREREVLEALRDHPGPTGISQALGISVNTVKTHLRNVYHKLDASSREEALWLLDGAHRSTAV